MKELFERAENGQIRSHRDLHIILDALPVCLSWASLPGGEIQFVNRSFKKTFGYPEGHFLTVQQWVDEAYVREADKARARSHWKHLWTTDATGISEVDALEVQVRCADGKIRTVLHRGILVHDIGIGIATFEDISAQKLAEDAMRRIALEDPLTKLANRRALQELWQAETVNVDSIDGRMVALLLIDLDDFKPVNDRLGHEIGDEVLKMAAVRLRATVRSSDLVSRLGGDEFVALLLNLKDVKPAEMICQRVAEGFRQPFVIHGQPIALGASVGACLYPQQAGNLTELLRHADEALYRVKRGGKGGWQWFQSPSGLLA